MEWSEQIKVVNQAIVQHQSSRESFTFFGKVTAYIYRPIYEMSVRFSVEGKILNLEYERRNEPKSLFILVGNSEIIYISNLIGWNSGCFYLLIKR